jgi:hypothetical protein
MERLQIMVAFLLDLKYGVRSLWRDKGFALTVLLNPFRLHRRQCRSLRHRKLRRLASLAVFDANSILIMSNEYPKAGVAGSKRQQFRGLFRPSSRNDGFREPGRVPPTQSNCGAEWFAATDPRDVGHALLVQTAARFFRARPRFH